MNWPRLTTLWLLLAVLTTACGGGDGSSSSPEPITGSRAQIAAVEKSAGDLQSGTVGLELATPLRVRVVGESGDPIAGQIVNFRVTEGGGSAFAGAAATNADGYAGERWTLGTQAGPQKMEVRAVNAAGVATVYATFEAIAVSGPPTVLVIKSGNTQSGERGRQLASQIIFGAADKFGNPTPNVTVSFSADNAGSTLPPSAKTDSTGNVATVWTLGSSVGTQTLTASADSLPNAIATANADVGAPYSITIVGGNQQTIDQHTFPSQFLTVRVSDFSGAPLPGVAVEFSVSPTSAYIDATLFSIATDTNGTSAFGGVFHSSGVQHVFAAVAGLPPADFVINVNPAGSLFQGAFDILMSSVVHRTALFRDGKLLPERIDRGLIRGTIDLATGATTLHDQGLDINNELSGTFVIQSDNSVIGSGIYEVIEFGVPSGRFGTWTATRIHD